MAATTILDSYGRPYPAQKLYPSPPSNPTNSRPRPQVRQKIYENNTERDRNEQVNYSKILATKIPNIDAAITMKADFSVSDAWHVRYLGNNKKWGKQMMAWLNESYFRNCNILGQSHDFRTTLRSLSTSIDKEADYGMVFDTSTGKAQVLDYSRIGTGYGEKSAKGLEKVKALGKAPSYSTGWGSWTWEYAIDDPNSPFDGARIIDGCIVGSNLEPLGYRILGFNEDGLPSYTDVPAAQVHFNYEAVWPNQLRGIPSLANLLDDACLTEDARYYWGQAILTAGSMAITRKSKDGRPALSGLQESEVTTTDLNGDERTVTVAVERRSAGIVELSTDNNEEIGSVDFNRPSLNEREYITDIETAYLHKHWPRGLIYTDDIDRAAGRAVTQQVRQRVWQRQCTLERTARWWIDRAIQWGMKTGRIPQYDAAFDPYNYEFTLPGEFTLDEGNDGKLWLSFLGRGAITRGIICNKQGLQAAEVADANEADEDDMMTRAERLAAKHDWISPKEALLRLNNPFTNPPPDNSQQQAEPGAEPKKKTATKTP